MIDKLNLYQIQSGWKISGIKIFLSCEERMCNIHRLAVYIINCYSL